MNEKGVETVTGKPVQTASKSEVGYSQVSRQENALIAEGNLCMEQLQKQRDQREASDSNSSGQLVQGVRLQDPSFKTCETHKPTVHDQDLPVPTKEVGNHSRSLNFLDGSI